MVHATWRTEIVLHIKTIAMATAVKYLLVQSLSGACQIPIMLQHRDFLQTSGSVIVGS